MPPPPPRSTLFPYTTLFRSKAFLRQHPAWLPAGGAFSFALLNKTLNSLHLHGSDNRTNIDCFVQRITDAQMLHAVRSEEHTSELQSQFHLVCRLLLEKKKKY